MGTRTDFESVQPPVDLSSDTPLSTNPVLFRRRSLVVRLLLLTAAAVTVPAILISAVYRSISSNALQESITQEQTELARRLADDLDNEVRQARNLLALIAHSSFFAAGSRVDQYEALHNLLDAVPAAQEAMFVSSQGIELVKTTRSGIRPSLVRRSIDLQKSYISPPFISGDRVPSVLLSEPVRSFSNPIHTGALVAKMNFAGLDDVLRQAGVGARGVAFMVNDRGTLLAHPNHQLVLAHQSLANLPVVADWMREPMKSTSLTEYKDPQGRELIALAYPIPTLRSAVIVQQPRSDVFAPLERMRVRFIIVTALSVLVFVAITIAFAWRILKPLRRLRSAAEAVGQGERDLKLNIQTNDELEELGQAFEQMAKSLSELEHMRADLINMVVHDLKMPLSTIIPSLEALMAGDVGELSSGQKHFIQMARRSGQEMLMLIQNLLDVAKMEEGRLTLHKEPFLPGDWARSVVANFKPLADGANKKLKLTVISGIPTVTGDIPLLSRVLGNLLSNALRHTPPGVGEVEITLYHEGNQLAIEVRDNGEGIPEEDQKRIFEKFVQGSGKRAPVRLGSGLGLTFCKMVVEAHGGRIHVFSQPDEGSVFTIHLPAIESKPADAPVSTPQVA